MLELNDLGGGRIDIVLDGEVDAAAMERVLDQPIEAASPMSGARLLFDVAEFHLPSLDAIRVKFQRTRQLFGLLKNIDRIAVLTDQQWMRQASKLESLLLPGVEMRAFPRADRVHAESWLAETNEAP